VVNPSIEEGLVGWRRVRSDGRELPLLVDNNVAHSGACSLRLNRRTGSDCPTICGYWTIEVMPVEANRIYRVSLWVRTSTSAAGSQLGVNFRTFNASGPVQEVGGIGRTINDNWMEITGLISQPGSVLSREAIGTWPSNTVGLIIDIAWIGSPARDGVEGDIWIDDVFFGLE
jgi:hypothetical protein